MTERTELERLEKAVVDADAAVDAAYAIYSVRCCTADVAYQELNSLKEYLKEQDNAVNAAYDTLRKSVLGRDYKLEQDND